MPRKRQPPAPLHPALVGLDPVSRNDLELLRALAATGQDKVLVHKDGRKPWRIVRDGRGWQWTTFHSLKERGYLTIEFGFAGGTEVGLTEAGRAAIGEGDS